MVVAVAAALISVLAAGESGSAATSYDPEELQFLRLINEYRQQHGAGPLILSDTLAVAAEHHSQDMGQYGFFAHNTAASSYYRVGSQPWDRMAAEGYDYNTIRGENLATGTETAAEAFEAWRESPSHNAAMLDGRYRVIGIARVYEPGAGTPGTGPRTSAARSTPALTFQERAPNLRRPRTRPRSRPGTRPG